MKLGYVGSGMMSKGSKTLTITGGNLLTLGLQAADVGTQVSVIFAGPSLPFVPRYPQFPEGTHFPGSMLVTKIASVDAGSVATLVAAAENDTLPNSNNVVVYREVSTDVNTPLKVQWTLTTSSRGTLTATIFDQYGDLNVMAGMPILLYDDALGDYFGGAVDTVTARNIPGKIPNVRNPIYWDIQCVSWSYVMDRRMISPFYPGFDDPMTEGINGPPAPPTPEGSPIEIKGGLGGNSGVYQPGQFLNMYLGDIFNQLLFGYCDSEGLSSNIGNGVGPVINFFQANPNQDTIAQAVENACQAHTSIDESWFWLIDAWKKAYLVRSQLLFAPWNVDESGANGPNETDASVLLTVRVETSREKLANRAYIDSNQTIGAITTEYYYTDRSKHSYSVSCPLGGAPKVWIARKGQIWNQTVAVKGAPKQSANWYWAIGDNSLEQETYTTLDGNIGGEGYNDIKVISPMRVNIDNLNVNDMRCMLQIESEYVRLRSGSMTKVWHVDRGATVRRLGAEFTADAVSHVNGTAITPAAMDDSNNETFNCTYPPMTKQLFTAQNENLVATQAGIESGRGLWETQVSLGAPFYDPYKVQGQQLADAFVQDYGVPPSTFEAATYRPGLQIGQIIYVHLFRPPVNSNFLIDQIDFTTELKRQKWTFHCINGALIGDWRKAFLGLSDQFGPLAGAGSTLAGAPGKLGSPVWTPGTEVPISGDPLYTGSSFSLAQDYGSDQAGKLWPQLMVRGAQQRDIHNAPIPIEFKVRREYVGGAVGQEAVIDPAKPGQIYLGRGTAPLPADAFKGRIMSKIANPYASNATLPINNFTINSHDSDGWYHVTPDPVALGCKTGDVFLIRTGRTVGTPSSPNDVVSTPDTFRDPLWPNTYGPGLIPHGNKGHLALIIGGKGAGQERQLILDNTADTITVSPGWAELPDGTSNLIIIDSATQVYSPTLATRSSDAEFSGYFLVPNYSGMTVRVEGYLKPSGVEEGSIETVPFREMYVWGAQGTRVVDASTTQPMRPLDGLTIFDTSGVKPPDPTTLAVAVDDTEESITLAVPYTGRNGPQIQVGNERMRILEGAGTATLRVARGWATEVSAHPAGTPVTLPGELPWQLVPYSKVPEQSFRFFKAWWNNDINYVRIYPATGDVIPNELPDGEAWHLLIDTSSSMGTYEIHVPRLL